MTIDITTRYKLKREGTWRISRESHQYVDSGEGEVTGKFRLSQEKRKGRAK